MAADTVFSGVLYDKLARTSRPVVLIGTTITEGGPGVPPDGGGNPPGIWGGPIDPYPGHPLPNPPPGTWPPQRPPHPAHPIVLPPDRPTDPPTEPPTNPADPQWVWGFNPNQGWLPVFVPGPTDPQPHEGESSGRKRGQ